jgi:hypothetical protein
MIKRDDKRTGRSNQTQKKSVSNSQFITEVDNTETLLIKRTQENNPTGYEQVRVSKANIHIKRRKTDDVNSWNIRFQEIF